MEEEIRLTRPELPPLEKYLSYLKKIWETGWLTNYGEFTQKLEKKLEEYLKVRNLILVGNGTLAIHLAFRVLGIKGEVITTPFTFAATTNAILWEGLKPIFADIDPETYNIDPRDVEKKITQKTSAIVAVHVYGNPCFPEELQEIAEKYGLKLIYDAAHAFGVEYKNKSILQFGDISTLSFHATKIFHTIEGGALVVKDKELVEQLRLMINHGIKSEEEVILPGTNAKMNEFQAAMGLCNLKYIDEYITKRRKLYDRYKEKLNDTGLGFQKILASKYNYIYMPVLFKTRLDRDKVYENLKANNIKARKYFYPLTANFSYFSGENLIKKYNLKVAPSISERILCLPLYSNLNFQAQDKVIKIIRECIED